MSDCPNPEFHGNPFRYCSCGWTEVDEQDAKVILARVANDNGSRTDLDDVIAQFGMTRAELEGDEPTATPSAEPDGEAQDDEHVHCDPDCPRRPAAPAQDGAEVDSLATLLGPTYRFCQSQAVTAKVRGQNDRPWLDVLLNLDAVIEEGVARDAAVAAKGQAKGWEDALQAVAWCLRNGSSDIGEVLTYVGANNPAIARAAAPTGEQHG